MADKIFLFLNFWALMQCFFLLLTVLLLYSADGPKSIPCGTRMHSSVAPQYGSVSPVWFHSVPYFLLFFFFICHGIQSGHPGRGGSCIKTHYFWHHQADLRCCPSQGRTGLSIDIFSKIKKIAFSAVLDLGYFPVQTNIMGSSSYLRV